MARTRSKALPVALAAGLLGAAWWATSDDDAGANGTDHLINQVWIERVPANDRDQIGHLLLIDHPRARRFGVAGRSSQWRHMIEVFMWQLKQGNLDLRFPQDRVRSRLNVRTWDCEDSAPEPFELCLELSRGDRKVQFYSRYEWEIEPQTAAEDLAELQEEDPTLSRISLDLPQAPAPMHESAAESADWPETARLP